MRGLARYSVAMDTPSFQDIDPSSGETITTLPIASAAEIDEAIARARAASETWSRTPMRERLRMLESAVQGLEARAEELASTVTQEMGKPIDSSRGEVRGWIKNLPEVIAELKTALAPEPFGDEGDETLVVREALGVVAAIAPWNFPIGMPLSILIPALGAGNAVVFKPSELVPLAGRILFEVLDAVLPDGVLQIVQGPGEVGARLVEGDVDMIGFVGSREVGRKIMAAASSDLKRLVLELGGKDPLLVFADADLEAAAECAVRHSLRNTGQVCCSVERVYVAREVAEDFERLVLDKATEWKTQQPTEEGSKMGPMASLDQLHKVTQQVDDAVTGGARLLMGGQALTEVGSWYPATVLADVDPDLAIARDETFGPVVCLTTFDGSEEEAIRLANDTPYGLGASL
ncbi:MAG: succinate-semialdehyde dehydrogenase/glutarate-semialdehyde dehydrogenase, partial [Planctomycetota bacterium]